MPGVITGNEDPMAVGRIREFLKIPPEYVTYTAGHTAEQADVGKVVWMNSASANSFTVPPDSISDPFILGQCLNVLQLGAGLTTIVAGSGVTIRVRSGLTLALAGQYALAGLYKLGANEWLAFGDLASS